MTHLTNKSNPLYELFICGKDQVSTASYILLPAFFRDLELNTRSLFKESFYLRPTLTSSQSN